MDWTRWAWSELAWTVALGATLVAWLIVALRLWQTDRAVPSLEPPPLPPPDTMPAPLPGGTPWPLVTAIVPARNEAAQVEPALRSLLAQDVPALEVVAIDDRSEDGTGAILAALAAESPQLTVLHVTDLPQGWLGKNHALHLGARHARGEWLLFTDADVVFAPGALRAALGFAGAHGLGHVVLGPRLLAPGYWERAVQATFALYFALQQRVWELRHAGTRGHVGMGAFNLVRRADYDRSGGHARLALEVLDDVKLGLLLRRAGTPQALAAGSALLSVRWQAGFWASLRGLLKNIFAATDYRWTVVLGGAATLCGMGLLPWLALFAAPGWPLRALAAALVAGPAAMLGTVARRSLGGSGLEGLALPVTHVALALTALLSAALATWRGSLVWRGTAYPLAALRRAQLRERDLPVDDVVGW